MNSPVFVELSCNREHAQPSFQLNRTALHKLYAEKLEIERRLDRAVGGMEPREGAPEFSTETAALLVEHRLSVVPWRQWVLLFEGPLAVRLGYEPRLLGRVCQRFAKRVMQTLRRQQPFSPPSLLM